MHQKRPDVEVEVGTSPTKFREIPVSTDFPRPRPVHPKDVQEESHRENQVSQVSEPTVYSTETGFIGQEDHSRPVSSERVHFQANFQNAYITSSETTTAAGSLDRQSGLERRFLAPQHSKGIQVLPRLQLQRPELALQSNALRPLYSPPNVHETDQVCSSPIGKGRHLVPTLSRRPVDNSLFQGRLHPEAPEEYRDPTRSRMADKLGEVQNRTQPDLRVAGSSLQFGRTHTIKFSPNVPTIQSSAERILERRLLHQEDFNETPGSSQLAGSNRPPLKAHPLPDEEYSETSSKSPFRCQAKDGLQDQITSCEMALSPQYYPAFGYPRTDDHCSDGRLPVRFRFHNRQPTFPGQVPLFNEKVFNKCPRTDGNLACHSYDQGEEPGDTDSNGQLHSNFSNKEINLNNIPIDGAIGVDLEESDPHELDLNSSSYSGEVQRDCRPAFTQHSHLNRMVASPDYIQANNNPFGAKVTSGSIRHKPKLSIRKLRLPMSRSPSSCSGRLDDQLEQMEVPLSLSPSPNNFEGFSETDTIRFRSSNTSFKRGTNEALVLSTEFTSVSVTNNRGKTAATRRRSASNRGKDFQASRLEVLKEANAEQFPDCDQQTIDLIASSVRKSSEADYQRKWDFFLQFIAEKGVEFNDIKIDIVLRFFSFLFYTKGLKPSTVSHYRSALARPLLEYLKVDLRIPKVNYMFRAMKLQRPNAPSPRPAWKLSKVLTYLETLDTTSEKNSLRKTAFLLLLATGWRISEIHACVRNGDFCRFTETHNVLLQPHSSFLAKNGLRRRLEAKEIKVLKLPDGQTSKICPVGALNEYLTLTARKKEGPLFHNPRDGSNISIFQLRYHICSLITEADPATKAKVHDIRKYAASCSLQQDMLVGDLTEDFNWSSPAIFYKFYFLQTDILDMPVALPARS